MGARAPNTTTISAVYLYRATREMGSVHVKAFLTPAQPAAAMAAAAEISESSLVGDLLSLGSLAGVSVAAVLPCPSLRHDDAGTIFVLEMLSLLFMLLSLEMQCLVLGWAAVLFPVHGWFGPVAAAV
ncbi:hypothetical protein Acr_25g0009250 [Actinidia rufa]|uniref:Uncharacterized protein n=1 Tax=Actinidia rufa TaxID=165716 RepID=A0A7J0H0D5_9ERIC|nr:hypothetical protein Acr_25g0009250 [Actinidia rufa]